VRCDQLDAALGELGIEAVAVVGAVADQLLGQLLRIRPVDRTLPGARE
jgi:hypothetical protein